MAAVTKNRNFGLIWFRGFRGEDLNVKVYDVRRTPSDGKSSHGLWPGELKSLSPGSQNERGYNTFFVTTQYFGDI
jgi:hypothetical protein